MRRIGLALVALAATVGVAEAAEKVSFITTWKAQAEHGGYYSAVAKGMYQACGIDPVLRQGGPGIDGKQLLVAGAVDIMIASYNDTAFQVNIAGFPAKAVAALFQKNPQILMAHPGVYESVADMKGKPIMIGAASRTTFWPFLRAKFGFDDSQIRPYSGQLAPWLVDKTAIQQGLITNEPNRVLKETGTAPKTFLLTDLGYPAYASIIVAPQPLIDAKPQVVQCFVDATIKGWIDFFKDPAPAVALIRKDNPDNPDEVVDYSIRMLKEAGIIESEETRKHGLGTMSDTRWKAHFDLLAGENLVPKDFDPAKAYTLQFVNKRVGM